MWNQNPQFVDVVSNYCEQKNLIQIKVPHLCKIGYITVVAWDLQEYATMGRWFQCKGYDQFFRTLDLTKKIYIDGGSPFHPLVDVTLTERIRKMDLKQKMFRPLTKECTTKGDRE